MAEKILPPGVKYAKEADVSAEMFRIGSNLQQGLGTGAKQQTIENLLVVEHQSGQLMREREDHMHIGNR